MRKSNHIELSEKCNDIITGCLLGDMYVEGPNGSSARLGYGCKYKEFLEYLKIVFEKEGVVFGNIRQCNTTPVSYKMASRRYAELLSLRHQWYNNHKVVPISIQINPTVLLFWYLGDGSIHYSKKSKNPSIRLASCCFSLDDNKLLLSLLEKEGLFGTLYYDGHYRISFDVENTKRFLKYIGKCPKEIYNIYGYKWREIKDGRTKKDWLNKERQVL